MGLNVSVDVHSETHGIRVDHSDFQELAIAADNVLLLSVLVGIHVQHSC